MNIINKAFLGMALLPGALYRRMGINTLQLKTILKTKLIMDDRRPNALHQTRQRRNKPVTLATLGTMLMSALMGALFLLCFSIGSNMATSLTLYFSMFFFMLAASLISDFTSVLIDVRDTFIILPKPVNDRTVLTARLLHIFIHICKIVLPMAVPGLIYLYVESGPVGMLVFLLLVFFVTAFSLFFINALYLLILRFTTPQRFQSIIASIQIIFAIVIYASYQVVPRMIGSFQLAGLDLTVKPGIIAYPLYWFGAGWQTLTGGPANWPATALGILLPFISLFTVVRYLAPSFNNRLALIQSSTGGPEPKTKAVAQRSRGTYAERLGRLVAAKGAERMGFLFTWKMTARSRDFKLKVYPSIGYLAVYVVIMLVKSRGLSLEEIREQGTSGKVLVISALYLTSMVLTMGINQAVYSDKFKASWIYYVAPLQKPGEVILGSAKAVIFKFYVPIVVFVTGAGLAIIGPAVLPNIVLGLFNEVLIATLVVYLGNKVFPFSLHQNNSVKAGSLLRSLLVVFISGLIAVGHYLVYDFLPVVGILAALSIVATWLMMNSIRNTSWKAVRSSYED